MGRDVGKGGFHGMGAFGNLLKLGVGSGAPGTGVVAPRTRFGAPTMGLGQLELVWMYLKPQSRW